MKAQIIQTLNRRFACKKYDPKKHISKADFDIILESGRLAPSSFGLEPWKILVVQNQDLIAQLFPIAWGARNSFHGASHFIIVLARKDVTAENDYFRHILQDIRHVSPEQFSHTAETFQHFQQHDFNLLQNDEKLFDWAAKQSYIMMANMMYTAALLDIDSCPIEGFDTAATNKCLENFGIDTTTFGVSFMLSFGYHLGNIPKKVRQPLVDIVEYL